MINFIFDFLKLSLHEQKKANDSLLRLWQKLQKLLFLYF